MSIIGIPELLTSIIFNFSDYSTIINRNPPDFTQRRKVLILTASRSGSSFLGEIFNQNYKALYFFEPLRPYMMTYLKYKALLEKEHPDFM